MSSHRDTENLLQSITQQQMQLEQQELDLELEFQNSEDDNISDLTFDRSAFDTSIYTHSRHDSRHGDVERGHDHSPVGGIELSEKNVRRFGARKGYAPALDEYSETESESSVQEVVARRAHRPRPLTRKELMTRDFARRTYEASSFESRFYNASTLVLISQMVVMFLMIRNGGILPLNENLMVGPSVYVMLDYGAQQGGFIIYEGQWWRLCSAMFVHAGLIHLACNAYVQWQICGFLSSLWGKFTWLIIFFTSGIFGNILSVIMSPDAVGVGSSGALMGVLAAWAVFIVITWQLVPEDQRMERNKQLCSLIVNIVIVIVIGQLEFVDGAAHLGGLIQGGLLGLFLLCDEQESINLKWFIRTCSLGAIIVLYIWAFAIAWNKVEPSEEVLLEYE